MRLWAYIFVSLCIKDVYSCPGLYQGSTCDTYQEVLTANKDNVPPGTDKILRSLDNKFSKCGPRNIDIRELTIARVQQYFKDGTLTSEQLTSCYLNRIKNIRPHLHALVEVNPDALEIARRADEERKWKVTGGLHGIPILLKDNIGTFDKMQTAVGAVALEDVFPKCDADVTKFIREAGAVLIGKSNPSEWTGLRGSNIPSGWSGRGGNTLNPYVLVADPQGGSAVAIAANVAMITLGSEIDGSIIQPSSAASLVGLKPTLALGKISTRGTINTAPSQFTIGPITRTVADARTLYNVVVNFTTSARGTINTPYRVGVVRNPFWNESDALIKKNLQILESALENLSARSEVNVIDPVSGDAAAYRTVSGETEYLVLLYEFKYYVNQYLKNDVIHKEGKLGRSIQTLADVIEFNFENPPPEGYNQDTLIQAEATDGLQNSTYRTGRVHNIIYARQYLNSLFDGNNLDAIAAPCESEEQVLYISFGAIAGYPSITIPVGINEDGLPVGLCFLGRPNSETSLLAIGEYLEEVQNGRQRPNFNLNPLTQQQGWGNNANSVKQQPGWVTGRPPKSQGGWAKGNPSSQPESWASQDEEDYSPPWPTESSLW